MCRTFCSGISLALGEFAAWPPACKFFVQPLEGFREAWWHWATADTFSPSWKLAPTGAGGYGLRGSRICLADLGCILIVAPERGHACPQRAPNTRRLRHYPGLLYTRTPLRTGMSALRF